MAPGNYELDYLAKNMPKLADISIVKISNFIGDALDMAAAEHFEEVLLVGHVGKLVKLAGGIMNTHSRQADCRTELFCTHAALCGAPQPVCRALMDAATTDACLAVLDEASLRAAVLESLLEAVQLHLDRRAVGAFAVGGGTALQPKRPARPDKNCGCTAEKVERKLRWYILWGQGRGHQILSHSAEMTLEQVVAVMKENEAAHKDTVRLHTGNPCLYGAIREQMDLLDAWVIDYDDTPGVSSFCGAAALNAEYTLPGVSQTVIITRMEGRTPVPEGERLAALAAHGATMVIFFSIRLIDKVISARC